MKRKAILVALALALSAGSATAGWFGGLKVVNQTLAPGLDILAYEREDGRWNCRVKTFADKSVLISCNE